MEFICKCPEMFIEDWLLAELTITISIPQFTLNSTLSIPAEEFANLHFGKDELFDILSSDKIIDSETTRLIDWFKNKTI